MSFTEAVPKALLPKHTAQSGAPLYLSRLFRVLSSHYDVHLLIQSAALLYHSW